MYIRDVVVAFKELGRLGHQGFQGVT